MRGRRTFVAALVAAVSACSLLGPDPGRLDALFGATPDAEGGASARACVPARPAGPAADAAPGGSDRAFAVIFSTLELLPPTDPRGFDLDDRCTCPEPPSCRGDTANPAACDGDGGIDNKLSGTLQQIPGADQVIGPDQLRQHFATGQSNVILYVTRYNGADNDDEVDVYLVRSTGTPKVDGSAIVPQFNGDDPFDCVTDDAVTCNASALVPAVKPQPAYVRNQVLVVPDMRFLLSVIAGYPINGRGTLSGRIEAFAPGAGGAPRYALKDGVLAGALPVSDVLMALALVESAPGVTFCTQPKVLEYFRNQLCAARDSTFAATTAAAPPPTGDAGADLPSCDAVSAVLSFEAVPFAPHDNAPLPVAAPCAGQDLQCD